ncbi:class I SAM-dependent methyltransferase [Candidatus Saccharibacteria bacterium]|nr:class I SAM-dependent methyltransferase [Candidatus Saccharibacteria bacterium]
MLHTKSSLRKVYGDLKGMMRFEEFHELYKHAKKVKKGIIVEVGSYRGMSTVALSLGARKNVKVFAVDPHETFTGVLGGKFGEEDRAEFYKTMLKTGAYKNVRLINLTSEVITPNWQEKVGMIFIDGDHSYKGVKRDFDCWEPNLLPECIVAFDDTDRKGLGPEKLTKELVNRKVLKTEGDTGKVSFFRLANRSPKK